MNERSIVVFALIWTGILVVLDRAWLTDISAYVRGKTGAAPATPGSSGKSGLGPDGGAGKGVAGGGGGSW